MTLSSYHSEYLPPRNPPLPLRCFEMERARDIAPFNPGPVDFLFRTHAAGLVHRPTAAQLRDWMNAEAPIPVNYHEAIRDTIAKMSGLDLMTFRQNNGSSIRGFAHLLHETHAFIDRAVHYVDQYSDIGDRRNRWDAGYAGSAPGIP